jgi:hypothetical protein
MTNDLYSADKVNELEERFNEALKRIDKLEAEMLANKNFVKPDVIESVCHCTTPIGSTAPDKCGRCGRKIGWQAVL